MGITAMDRLWRHFPTHPLPDAAFGSYTIYQLCAGGISSALAAVLAGAKHAFLPKFSAAELACAILQHRATAMIAVPTMLQDLVQYSQKQKHSVVVLPCHEPEYCKNWTGQHTRYRRTC